MSEYFTPAPELRRSGFDRLVRLAVGVEDADDLIAALNWTLHHYQDVSPTDVDRWQAGRLASLRA